VVESPGFALSAQPAGAWSAEGPLAERALAFARRFAGTLPAAELQARHLVVEQSVPEHVGLGSGTQLGMAVARALWGAGGRQDPDPADLACRVGRGLRSAIGVHGFARGGFLVDAGARQPGAIAPLVARQAFPEDWRVVLVLPPRQSGLHGPEEQAAFRELSRQGIPPERTDPLCRLVLLGMLPALVEEDAQTFGEAVYEYNARVGECFAPVQGGVYANPCTADLIDFMRRQGVPGAGQSSWGPAAFAIASDPGQAFSLAQRVRVQYGWGPEEVFVTRANNQGATIVMC
jgi:beta-RFAP synthase